MNEEYTPRYYLITTDGQGNRLEGMKKQFTNNVHRRAAHEVFHWVVSLDKSLAIAEVYVTEEEHQWATGLPYVTYLGGRDEHGNPDEAVRQYMIDNYDLWNSGKGMRTAADDGKGGKGNRP